ILHDMAKLIIKTASGCLLGHEIRAKLDDSVADIYHDLDGGFTPMQFMFEWLPLPSYYKRDAAHKKMSDLFYDIVQERRKSEKQNDDVVDALMRNSYKDGTMMTDRQVAHMMIALLMGGQHTSSTTSSWTLLLLAQNPEIQEELLKEQKEVFGEDLKDLTLDGLKKCTLLESCIKETLRMRPPIINVMRYVKQNCEIPNTSYVIPQGYYVMSAPIITQLDEKCFPNAESYLPKRWLDPSIAAGTNKTPTENVIEEHVWATMNSSSARSSYLPFGAGRHRCVGEQFAYMQISTIISVILRNYRIKLNTEAGFPNINFATLICSPLDPNLIEYEPRN
ncbi:cytochrome P450, partial [Conidiobolus coronatus NRRL 28638]